MKEIKAYFIMVVWIPIAIVGMMLYFTSSALRVVAYLMILEKTAAILEFKEITRVRIRI